MADPNKVKTLIHVAWGDCRKRLPHLTEEDYRAVLQRATGLDSTQDMTAEQLDAVMKILRGKPFGFRVRHKTRPGTGKPKSAKSRPLDLDAQARKVRALWLDLHERGAVRDPNESALAAYVRRQTGKDALQWLAAEEIGGVIEALKKWQFRTVMAGAVVCPACGIASPLTRDGAIAELRGLALVHCDAARPMRWQPQLPKSNSET